MSGSDLLVVTAGEPAGIGPELCLALAASQWAGRVVVVADPSLLAGRARKLGLDVKLRDYVPGARGRAGELTVLAEPLAAESLCGRPDPANAESVLAGLKRAVDGCSSGEFAAIVTAPVQKSVINDAGIPFTGHTEFLAKLTGAKTPVMLLVAGDLRVALATTHLPLREVPDALTTNGIVEVVRVLHADLQSRFGIKDPDIVVCGLNPHAGEGGHLGTEDREIIAPAIARCASAGMRVRGPLPADTAFTPAAGRPDAVLAMYHDQGLPVVKYAGFGSVVNVTLGLPIVRTSVDHGTALDIAGLGKADPGSLFAAVRMAAALADT
ncbi:MAG: 4-hydroxythreonine-4-phosphate dehydrogenase PdxA [Gammaproteobacteria bacterium]|nr:4-hydroxythreonine-4-phosphate dehydrogenase PdxA [Gammaproteobacteria bacterium]